MLKSNHILTEKAFELVGLADRFTEYSDGDGTTTGPPLEKGHCPFDENWEECQCELILESQGPVAYDECMEKLKNPPPGGGSGGGSGYSPVNACGCPKGLDSREATGRVAVWDTQFGALEGVNGLRIDVWRKNRIFGRFGHRTTYTNENGCWRIIGKSYKGKIKVVVSFNNQDLMIRGMNRRNVWNSNKYFKPIQDKFSQGGPNFSNICRDYMPIADDASDGKKYYFAATAQNAFYEYRGYANQDNIPVLSDQLQILIAGVDESASTPMFQHIGNYNFMHDLIFSNIHSWLEVGVWLVYGSQTVEDFVAAAPDMFYGYGAETIANGRARSDQVKETFYHEYAHVSHYSVGSDDYWRSNVEYVVSNGGYGDGTGAGAGRTAVIEMWGFHYGKTLANQQYGLRHSITNESDPEIALADSYIYQLEQFIPSNINPSLATGFPNETDTDDSWIPSGVFYDCLDDNSLNPPLVNEPSIIVDGVMGYDQSDFLNAIINAENIMTVRDNLTGSLPTGQTTAVVNALFLSYGY